MLCEATLSAVERGKERKEGGKLDAAASKMDLSW